MQELDPKKCQRNGLFAVGKRKVAFFYVDLSRLKSLTVKWGVHTELGSPRDRLMLLQCFKSDEVGKKGLRQLISGVSPCQSHRIRHNVDIQWKKKNHSESQLSITSNVRCDFLFISSSRNTNFPLSPPQVLFMSVHLNHATAKQLFLRLPEPLPVSPTPLFSFLTSEKLDSRCSFIFG